MPTPFAPTRPRRERPARPPDLHILAVRVGAQRVGFLAGDVVEIQRMVAVEPLPGAPNAVEGVLDLRGRIVPVLDLRERFGLPSREPHVDDHLVVVRSGRHVVAVRVDQALSLERIAEDSLVASEDVGAAGHRVAGVARSEGSLIVVADLAAFLGWEERGALDAALGGERSPRG